LIFFNILFGLEANGFLYVGRSFFNLRLFHNLLFVRGKITACLEQTAGHSDDHVRSRNAGGQHIEAL
jgi:hypothetical protein